MKRINFFLLAGMFLLFSCAKDGEMGPQGPAGPAGQDGQDSQDANVKTEIYKIPTSEWELTGPQANLAVAALNTDIITEEDVDASGIFLYMDLGYSPYELPVQMTRVWFLLPFWGYNFSANSEYVAIFGEEIPSNDTTYFKLIVIEGSLQKSTSINWSDYNDVRQQLDLKD